MGYLPPTTIAETLRRIQGGEIVLPAIQREYVWEPHQVTALFDSLMRGYPVGSFLSWRVEPETVEQFRFYGFMRDYSEYDNRHCPSVDLPPRAVTALLDGQQRLTSLNIGLRGTYAYRVSGGWRNNPSAYPKRRLFLNVRDLAPVNEAGLKYDLRLLTEKQLATAQSEGQSDWFPVADVFSATKMGDIWRIAAERGWGNDPDVQDMLSGLWEAIHSTTALHFYEERDQDVERVLDIFIRVNSGGSVLSYSDLLLSIATAQWRERDAREEIHRLVDALNGTGQGFNFSQDAILKAGLVLAGVGDFAFRVKNFNATNMALLNKEWDRIAESLQLAAELLADMGLSEASLPADSVLIPVAYYVHHRNLREDYRTAPKYTDDRLTLRSWVLRSLVQPGVWGSGLDTLLRELRQVIDSEGEGGFPLMEIEQRMAARGKALSVTDELVEDLLEHRYGQKRTFALLAILFPHVNTRNLHHVDHIFPTALLYKKQLRQQGMSDADIEVVRDLQNRLPNLQLLEGSENISKSAAVPSEWVEVTFATDDRRSTYLERNALPWLPTSALEFEQFFKDRRQRLADLIKARLSGSNASKSDGPDVSWSLPHDMASEPAVDHSESPPSKAAPSAPIGDAAEELTFVLRSDDSARARVVGSGVRVLAGTRARRWMTEGTAPSYERLQAELISRGLLTAAADGSLEFASDVDFNSSSAAASVVTGRSARGPMEWQEESSATPLAQWLEP